MSAKVASKQRVSFAQGTPKESPEDLRKQSATLKNEVGQLRADYLKLSVCILSCKEMITSPIALALDRQNTEETTVDELVDIVGKLRTEIVKRKDQFSESRIHRYEELETRVTQLYNKLVDETKFRSELEQKLSSSVQDNEELQKTVQELQTQLHTLSKKLKEKELHPPLRGIIVKSYQENQRNSMDTDYRANIPVESRLVGTPLMPPTQTIIYKMPVFRDRPPTATPKSDNSCQTETAEDETASGGAKDGAKRSLSIIKKVRFKDAEDAKAEAEKAASEPIPQDEVPTLTMPDLTDEELEKDLREYLDEGRGERPPSGKMPSSIHIRYMHKPLRYEIIKEMNKERVSGCDWRLLAARVGLPEHQINTMYSYRLPNSALQVFAIWGRSESATVRILHRHLTSPQMRGVFAAVTKKLSDLYEVD